jgi:hypothetical protein
MMNIENITGTMANSRGHADAEELWDAVEYMAQSYDVPADQLARFLVDRIDKIAAVQNLKKLT